MSMSGAQNVVRGVHSSSAWDVAWDVVEDELLGMTLGTMAVALQGSLCLGPQIQVTDIERNIAWVIAGDVPENIMEALLASVLLALVSLASVLLASVSAAEVMFVGSLFVRVALALASSALVALMLDLVDLRA